jgi:hypothetical protein
LFGCQGVERFIVCLSLAASKFYGWRNRYGKANEHNAWVPRDFWLEEWEKDWHPNKRAFRDVGGQSRRRSSITI